ncbi:MAG: hypothetical protein Q8K18_14660 [Burkholderiales bacterium]|nr:hypothetical protein [Burkholderiales bacterium]
MTRTHTEVNIRRVANPAAAVHHHASYIATQHMIRERCRAV